MKSMYLRTTLSLSFCILGGTIALPSPESKIEPRGGFGGFGDFNRAGISGFKGLGDLGDVGLRSLNGIFKAASSNIDNNGGSGCAKYKIISARGTGENQVKPTGCIGFISGVLSAVPGGADYEVRYPATVDYATGPIQGAADAMRFISEQRSKCPKQLYVLIGYSEGAMVITQLLNKPQIPSSSIAAVVLYGNPYFRGGAPQNACSAKTGAGDATATGIRMPDKFSSVTFDCCVTGDMICQTAGTIIPHLAYPGSQYEKDAVRFVAGKLNHALSGAGVDQPGSNEGEKGSSSSSEDGGNDSSNGGSFSFPGFSGKGGAGWGPSGGNLRFPSWGGNGDSGLGNFGANIPSLPSFGGGNGGKAGFLGSFGGRNGAKAGFLGSLGGGGSGLGGNPSAANEESSNKARS